MTLELYNNTELGAVIDRTKDTRCIAICIAIWVFHIAIHILPYCTVAPLIFSNKQITKELIRAGLCLCCSQIPEDRFSNIQAHLNVHKPSS